MSWAQKIADDGFAITTQVFSHERVDQLLDDIRSAVPLSGRAGVRHALRLESVSAFSRERPLLELARQVLGVDAFPFRATLFDKSSSSNWLVVWHQDRALPLKQRFEVSGWGPWTMKGGIQYAIAPESALRQVLALRIHFDGSTKEDGPLRVLPATHCVGVLADEELLLKAKSVPPVDCVVPKGGVLAMRPLLVHASSKARNRMPRRVLHIEYAASESAAAPFELAVA